MTYLLSISPRENRAKWVLKKLYHNQKEAIESFELACTLNLGTYSKRGNLSNGKYYVCGFNDNNIVELKNI